MGIGCKGMLGLKQTEWTQVGAQEVVASVDPNCPEVVGVAAGQVMLSPA